MTAKEIFQTACSYASQTLGDSADIEPFWRRWINVLLAECLPVENTLRVSEGKDPLEKAPNITKENENEPIPYHMELTDIALPYGLASDIYRDNDDNYRVQKFRDLYISQLEEAKRAESETVVDVYG